ncbi:MAG: arginine repressor [Candidatus Dormibacteria bacterium]|jgi:transcriptional regulator of arginine metabolism
MTVGSVLGPVAKAERQQAILDLVRDRKVRTQEEIVAALHRRGLDATQATVSRDIRELGLARVHDPDGLRYVPGGGDADEPSPVSTRLRAVMREHVRSMEFVEHIGVLHTRPSSAPLVAAVIDTAHFEEVAGTVAGDDTVLVVVRSRPGARRLAGRLREAMTGGAARSLAGSPLSGQGGPR